MRRGSPRAQRTVDRPVPFAEQTKPPRRPVIGGFAGLIKSVEHEILAVTFWFEPSPHRNSDSALIRVSGQRVGIVGPPQPGDRFLQEEKVEGIVAGAGPISVTARVFGINQGEWMVTAKMLNQNLNARTRPRRGISTTRVEPVYPAAWSWRTWKLSKGASAPVKTALLPFIKVPGVISGFWTVTAVIGMVAAVAIQALVISRADLKVDNALMVSVFAIALGLIGAKIWFIVLRRRERRVEGWCIHGFLVGIVAAAAAGFAVFHLPVGVFLDASTPGVLVGMAIGRLGCFFGGCCAGRPTASRWGLWSVLDQRLGMRRIPTQLMESLLALVIGLAALVTLLGQGSLGGALFVAAISAYTLGRQGILRLRGGPGKSARITELTAIAAASVFAADLVIVALDSNLR